MISQIHFETVSEHNLAKASKLVASSAADHVFSPSLQDWNKSLEKTFINKRSEEENDVDGSDSLPPIDDQELLFIRTSAAALFPLINAVILNQLDNSTMSILNASRVVMIPKLKLEEKDDGNIGLKHDGFRAIGVGDCLYRLIMRWAAVQISAKVLDIVKSRQFAIKVSGGAEIEKHCLIEQNKINPTIVLFRLTSKTPLVSLTVI